MCSQVWLDVTFYTSIVGFTISVVFNAILIWLLYNTPRKRFGNYRYLMMVFAGVGILFSFCNLFCRPTSLIPFFPNVLITDSSLYVFTSLKAGFKMTTGTISVIAYCSCYATILSLLAIQFFYRYTSVTAPWRLVIFGVKNLHKWGSIVLVYSLVWAAIYYFLCGPSELKRLELDEEILKAYCLAPEEYAYVGSQYFYRNPTTGETTWHLPSLIGTSSFFLLILATFLMVIYFGIRIFRILTDSGLTAYASKELQKQFFRTLICQTLIPFYFMYLPVICLFVVPLTGWKPNGMENWVPMLAALYPCLEPMVALYCMKDFRNKIYNFLTCNRAQNRVWSVLSLSSN